MTPDLESRIIERATGHSVDGALDTILSENTEAAALHKDLEQALSAAARVPLPPKPSGLDERLRRRIARESDRTLRLPATLSGTLLAAAAALALALLVLRVDAPATAPADHWAALDQLDQRLADIRRQPDQPEHKARFSSLRLRPESANTRRPLRALFPRKDFP
jgi:hypothetical protein